MLSHLQPILFFSNPYPKSTLDMVLDKYFIIKWTKITSLILSKDLKTSGSVWWYGTINIVPFQHKIDSNTDDFSFFMMLLNLVLTLNTNTAPFW